jgi:hypothetical protein
MSTAQVVVKLRGGPRPMSVVVNPGQAGAASDFAAPFGPDDVVRFSGIPAGRARVEISRHAMPPLLALRTVDLKGGETAEIEVVLDTLVDMTGLVVRAPAGDKTPLEAVAYFKNGKSQSSTLSSDGSFRFRDVPQGPCTVEVRTFDKAQRLLWSQLLTEIPAARLDIELDVSVEVEPAARPTVEKAPLPSAPKITGAALPVAAAPVPRASPARAPVPRPSPAKAPVPRPSHAKAPAPRPSPAKVPVIARAAPVPAAPVAPAPVAAAPVEAPAPVAEKKAGKKAAAPKKEGSGPEKGSCSQEGACTEEGSGGEERGRSEEGGGEEGSGPQEGRRAQEEEVGPP